jgi:hypothetical protein
MDETFRDVKFRGPYQGCLELENIVHFHDYYLKMTDLKSNFDSRDDLFPQLCRGQQQQARVYQEL